MIKSLRPVLPTHILLSLVCHCFVCHMGLQPVLILPQDLMNYVALIRNTMYVILHVITCRLPPFCFSHGFTTGLHSAIGSNKLCCTHYKYNVCITCSTLAAVTPASLFTQSTLPMPCGNSVHTVCANCVLLLHWNSHAHRHNKWLLSRFRV